MIRNYFRYNTHNEYSMTDELSALRYATDSSIFSEKTNAYGYQLVQEMEQQKQRQLNDKGRLGDTVCRETAIFPTVKRWLPSE